MTAFANGLSARAMPGSRRLGERFQWRRVPHVSEHFMPGGIQRGAFFLTVEVQKEAVPVVSKSLRVALSSHRTESSYVVLRWSEYSDFSGGGFLLFRNISCLVAFNEVLSF